MCSFSSRFVNDKFSEYYKGQSSTIQPPSSIEKREFGFLLFDEKIMLRHKRFKTPDALRVFFSSFAFSDAYYSCAYYEDPEAEMEKKGWLGADLIFDIDADHIPAGCSKTHDRWACNNCGFTGRGVSPERCPICGSQKFKVDTWLCDICLGSAKTETLKLFGMLTMDFGFHESEVKLFFSGHRGYHVHIENETVKTLDSSARKEIVDYVCGLGIDAAFRRNYERGLKSPSILKSLSSNSSGWHRRIVSGIRNLILNIDIQNYKNMGLKKNITEIIVKNKDMLLKKLENGKTIDLIREISLKNWEKIIKCCINFQSVKVDTVVTTDIHRLIRLANTLHGKTGLKKVQVPFSNIEDFDPFKSAVAFNHGRVSVFVSDVPEFRMGDETFGPYKNQKVELPTAAAVLLICKGRAEVLTDV
ncbi:DNA primase small subunit PriS [Candidatus Bathyarchaeota archaeon]|nr:DNA primase small subunit PriS [Candidatus Bathyarchaeota archaeon]